MGNSLDELRALERQVEREWWWLAIYTLIEACKLNGIDPRAWFADVLARVPDHPAKSITELLRWQRRTVTAAA
jgi:hypothetical protein